LLPANITKASKAKSTPRKKSADTKAGHDNEAECY
jgi:hypothetical protein